MPEPTQREQEITRRLADGEDPWVIDPDYGCTNPLTGYFPTAEVEAETARRGEVKKPDRLMQLERKQASTMMGLSPNELIELENLQSGHASALVGRQEPDVDPITGAAMEYNPAQINRVYTPVEDPRVVAIYRQRVGLTVEPAEPTRWWTRLARRFRGH